MEFLRARFPQPFLRLTEPGYHRCVLSLTEHGITGGAAYDALVAATAAAANAELVTCDRRAAGVYDAYGVRFHLLG
jgi:predicted nucleic acid-binding protein